MKKLIFLFLIFLTNSYFLDGFDKNLIKETFVRGDYFNTITFAKELFFYSNNDTDRCFSSLYIAESFARLGNEDRSFRWLNRARRVCGESTYYLFLAYLSAELNINNSIKLLHNEKFSKISQNKEKCIISFVILAKNLRFKEAIKMGKLCVKNNFFTSRKLNLFKICLIELVRQDHFYSEVWKLGIIPGLPQFLMGKPGEGIGEVFVVTISLAGITYSFLNGGFFELWFFPLLNYYFGGIFNSYKFAKKSVEEKYREFSSKLNQTFLYEEQIFDGIVNK